MKLLRCPVCGKTFQRSETDAMPFCSERCRLIDLGRWIDESYSVPVEGEVDEDAPISCNGNSPSEAE